MILRFCSIFIFLLFLGACQKPVESNKTLLVKVGNEKLYMEDFVDLIPFGTSSKDSSDIVNHHIDNWIKETLFRLEAEQKAEKSQIEDLVTIYRNSLLVHDYESRIIEENLDSLISDQELYSTYQEHKADFILTEPAYLIFSVEAVLENANDFTKLWKEREWEKIEQTCIEKGFKYHISDSLWIVPRQAGKYFDEEMVSKVSFEPGFYTFNKLGEKNYFLQIRDVRRAGRQAPFNVVEKQVRKLILHKRSRELLEKEKADLYQEAISGNSIVKYSENSE